MKDKGLIVCAMLFATAVVWPHQFVKAAQAASKQVNELFLDSKMQEISKRQAMRALINSDGVILRCSQVELSDKMTIRKKK